LIVDEFGLISGCWKSAWCCVKLNSKNIFGCYGSCDHFWFKWPWKWEVDWFCTI